jgi:hypothetical protein
VLLLLKCEYAVRHIFRGNFPKDRTAAHRATIAPMPPKYFAVAKNQHAHKQRFLEFPSVFFSLSGDFPTWEFRFSFGRG